mgnify:CR=1 FL=1
MTTYRDSAVEILRTAKVPMSYTEIHKALGTKCRPTSISAAIYVDIDSNPHSPLVKLGPNLFGLAEWDYVGAIKLLNHIHHLIGESKKPQ